MISFLIYEGKVAIALAVFYMFYRLMLRKETFHRLNRVVLVGTVVLAFVLPLCIITIHTLRHSAASHLLENGESLLDVQKRLGHVRLTTTMVYLHVADIEPMKHVRLIDTIFPPKR